MIAPPSGGFKKIGGDNSDAYFFLFRSLFILSYFHSFFFFSFYLSFLLSRYFDDFLSFFLFYSRIIPFFLSFVVSRKSSYYSLDPAAFLSPFQANKHSDAEKIIFFILSTLMYSLLLYPFLFMSLSSTDNQQMPNEHPCIKKDGAYRRTSIFSRDTEKNHCGLHD